MKNSVLIAMAILVAVLSLVLFFKTRADKAEPEKPPVRFFPLDEKKVEELEEMRAAVLAAASERYGTERFTGTIDDLDILQKMIDDNIFSPGQIYEYDCMGVVFGDILASELELEWWMMDSQFGVDPVLRYKDTSIAYFAVTMISKRVEENNMVPLEYLINALKKDINKYLPNIEEYRMIDSQPPEL